MFAQPDGDLDRDSDAVIAEHKPLQRLVPELVVADGWNDEPSCLRRCVLLAVNDDVRDVGSSWRGLRRACLRVVVAAEEVMRACGRDALEKIRDGCEARVAAALVIERPVTKEGELRPVEGVKFVFTEFSVEHVVRW